jgi:hypothetical protein
MIRSLRLEEAAAKATGDGVPRSLKDIVIVGLDELRGPGTSFSCAFIAHRGAHIAIARVI